MNHNMEEKALPQCPFWRELRGQRVGCEGLTDHCRIILCFDAPETKQQHEEVFCCEHYDYCEIYNAVLEAKYAGEGA
jgi:hypothetical protein